MKVSQFAKVLRQLIREEVKAVVKEELKPIKSVLLEKRKPTTPTAAAPVRPVRKATTPPVNFDGPLGSLLNETAQSMLNESYTEEWPDMNNGTFTSEDAPNFGGASLMNALNDDFEEAPVNYGGSDPTRMFIKDYSAVMKAADAHAGGRF